MDAEGFGNCTNHGECEAVWPRGIKIDVIARMNRDYLKASLPKPGQLGRRARDSRPQQEPDRSR